MSAKRSLLWGVTLLAAALAFAGAATADDDPPADEPLVEASPVQEVPPVERDSRQVNVSVKIIEFQATKGVDTGFSAYFQQQSRMRYGQAIAGSGAIANADLTFPISTSAGITVFLDRLNISNYDLELVLQALVDESRALILARPKAMVMVGSDVPTAIETSQQVPYESMVVVGQTAVQVTAFETTGVRLNVRVPEIIDDDGDPLTQDDAYVRLEIDARVSEQGQRIVVALDDRLVDDAGRAITVPEFVTRRLNTEVWVRNGQVLVLGGLYRNVSNRSLASPPFLQQGEDIAAGLAQRFIPGDITASPISTTLGNRSIKDERRELVFLIKADIWRPAFAVMNQFGFAEEEEIPRTMRPTDVITSVIEGITEIPLGIAEGIARETPEGSVDAEIRGRER